MQEKNRLFVLDLFRNCVDRTANMRSFIASMGGPKGGTKAPEGPHLMHSKPVMEPSKDTTQSTSTARATATETVAVGVIKGTGHGEAQSSSSSSSSSSSKPKEINAEATVKCPKRKTPLSSSSSRESACASVKKSIAPQKYSEAKHTAVSSSAVIELSDAEEEEVVLDHSDDTAVQRVKRKKGSVTVTMKSSDRSGRAVTLVTPECAVSAGEGDRRASRWVCAICTYCHSPEEWQYLQCALCASNRPALSVPSQVS
jgi:hypothetical protein